MKRKRERRMLTHWRGLTSGLVRTRKNPSEWGAHLLEKVRMGLVRWKESSWQGHLLAEGTEDGPACTAIGRSGVVGCKVLRLSRHKLEAPSRVDMIEESGCLQVEGR